MKTIILMQSLSYVGVYFLNLPNLRLVFLIDVVCKNDVKIYLKGNLRKVNYSSKLNWDCYMNISQFALYTIHFCESPWHGLYVFLLKFLPRGLSQKRTEDKIFGSSSKYSANCKFGCVIAHPANSGITEMFKISCFSVPNFLLF